MFSLFHANVINLQFITLGMYITGWVNTKQRGPWTLKILHFRMPNQELRGTKNRILVMNFGGAIW